MRIYIVYVCIHIVYLFISIVYCPISFFNSLNSKKYFWVRYPRNNKILVYIIPIRCLLIYNKSLSSDPPQQPTSLKLLRKLMKAEKGLKVFRRAIFTTYSKFPCL